MIAFPQFAHANRIAANTRRLMARYRMSKTELAKASGVDLKTLRAILEANGQVQPRTIGKLAEGMGVPVEEFERDVAAEASRFDRATNTIVEAFVQDHPELFTNWGDEHFAELYSRFAVGGQLTEAGVLAVALFMNRRRAVEEKFRASFDVEPDWLEKAVGMVYDRLTVVG